MMDLHSRMERFGGPVEPPSDAAVQDDLARGRTAARRQRVARATAGTAFAVVAVAAGFALTAGGPLGAVERPPAVARSVAPDGIQLVGYAGAQPQGFTIDTVPAGFSIQRRNEYELVLAPDRPVSPRPVSSVPVIENPDDYAGKIAIFLQGTEDPADLSWGEQLTIDGRSAVLRTVTSPDGSQLGGQFLIPQTPDVHLTVQFSETVGLTREQAITLAGGVHVTPEHLATVG